jgi:hypothetical protein
MSYCSYSRLYQNCNGDLTAPTSSTRYLMPTFQGYNYPSITLDPNDEKLAGIIYQNTSLPENVEYRWVNKENYQISSKPFNEICPKNEKSETCELDDEGKSVCGSGELYSILDPRFNLRESAKNMILLEDHLFHKGKRCKDCILKHLLTIEGFLEEAITLDKNQEYHQQTQDTIDKFRVLFREISKKIKDGTLTDKDCCELAQNIRKLRKPLCQTYATFI